MIIIGEKINATLAPVKPVIQNRDTAGLLGLAKGQVAAGAHFIDINVGTGVGSQADEVEAMKWAVADHSGRGGHPALSGQRRPGGVGSRAGSHQPAVLPD